MTKYSFKPVSVHLIPSVPLLLSVTFVCLFSTGTLGVSHGFVDRVACSCFTVLMSNLLYVVMTTMQCLKFQLQCLCNPKTARSKQQQLSKEREAVVDDRLHVDNNDDIAVIMGQYSLKNILCNTVEFKHTPREVRLFVNRKELWYTMYPTAFAVFVLFYCLPIYDVSCTVSLILGLLSKSTYDELKRGIYWKRSTGRTVCLVIATLSGVLCAIGLLVLSAVINRHSWGQSSAHAAGNATVLAASAELVREASAASSANYTPADNMIGTLLHGDRRENALRRRTRLLDRTLSSNATEGALGESSVVPVDDIGQDVRDALSTAYTASIQNPNLGQMIVMWAACSYIPFFLGHTPESIRLPVLLEIIQPSISCIAAVVLFLASATSQHGWSPVDLLRTPSMIAYLFLVPVGVWCAVFFLIRASRSKTTAHACCILMVAAYSKLMHMMSAFPARGHGLRSVSVFVGIVCGVYSFLTVVFIRMENKSIQMGWDTSHDDDDEQDDEYGMNMDFSASDGTTRNGRQFYDEDDGPIHARYSIEDVLQRVTNDIKTTEYILSNPQSKSTLSHSTPRVDGTDASSSQNPSRGGGDVSRNGDVLAKSVRDGSGRKHDTTLAVIAEDQQPASLDAHEVVELEMHGDDDVKLALLSASAETQSDKQTMRSVRSVVQHALSTKSGGATGS